MSRPEDLEAVQAAIAESSDLIDDLAKRDAAFNEMIAALPQDDSSAP